MIMNRDKLKHRLPQIILVAFLGLLCITFLLPFCWTLSTSLRSPADSFKMPPSFFPTAFEVKNYFTVTTRFPFLRFILNSLCVAVAVVFFSLTTSSTAAFAFSRISFKGKQVLFILFMAGLMIPSYATMISVYIIMSKLRLVGSLWALIIPAMINPLHIFLIRQYMMTIPKSYEEAAEIDGCSRFGIYLNVIMPMSKPVLMLAALQAFIASWNNFVGPLIYLSDWNKMTLPIGLKLVQGYMGTGSISEILAGIVISLIAPVLLFAFGQRYLIQGIALTGLKS